jgi:predicted  nucleic acid-binding Zn-ribbon protein
MTETSSHLLELNEVDRELHERNGTATRTLKERRQHLIRAIDPVIASRYEALKHRFGIPMVRFIHGYCEGCHMSVPSSLAQRIKRDHEVLACENCGRFLYSEHD